MAIKIFENAVKKTIGEIEENQMFQGFKIYEIYNGKSGGAYRASRYLAEAIKSKPSKCLYSSLNEGIQFEPSPDKKGGIIVFSTDVIKLLLIINLLDGQ